MIGAILQKTIILLPEREQLKPNDFLFMIRDNAIIPNDREQIICKALCLGIKGEYYECLHLLVHQLENIFRGIARMCGGLTTTFEDNGIEQAMALSSVFDIPELIDCYDEDVLFLFKGLLDEKAGANLRNRIAHGIMDANEANSGSSVYFVGCHDASIYVLLAKVS